MDDIQPDNASSGRRSNNTEAAAAVPAHPAFISDASQANIATAPSANVLAVIAFILMPFQHAG